MKQLIHQVQTKNFMNSVGKIKNNFITLLFFSVFLIFSTTHVAKQNKKNLNYISTKKTSQNYLLSSAGNSIPLYVSSEDHAGVLRVIKHLQKDIENVTGAKPLLSIDDKPTKKEIIIVGSIDNSPIIKKLIKNKIIDVSDIEGKWETFIIQTVKNPLPNIDKAIVIAGSDKRGTIFGMFDLSEKIGVSPWYWWADVPVNKKQNLYMKHGRYTIGEPKVKYRGIFINDEAPALTGWAFEKYGGFNAKFYENVFELILRMKGNFLWPAMWGRAFYDDDANNPKLADEYGIVISTSHHEPMMRAHDEWRRYGEGDWNYSTNDVNLSEFWKKGIERMGDYESIVTLAMRGDGDEPMSEESNIAVLEKIVKDQREIIKQVSGKSIESTPQVWALYKEVQDYYDRGMRVPDDVTLLLCDDNWGNIRKLPKLSDPPRSGGYGIYYHYDYVGGPRSYRWLNTNPIGRVWEQMNLAYEYGVDRIWLVNVGDIKPMEFPIEFFLDFAWNPKNIDASDLTEYTRNWAEEQFGEEHSEDIADLITKYHVYNGRRKPELLEPGTYSLTNFREAKKIRNDFKALLERANKISILLPKEYSAAFYQLVLHPIEACSNINDLYITTAQNRLYAEQGRAKTNELAQRVKTLFHTDAEITNYYNNKLLDGKWSHMMDQTHIGYTNWNNPDENIMPEVEKIINSEVAEMGVAIEGSTSWWPDEAEGAVLPEFDPFNNQTYYIEIFNRGLTPFQYSIEASEEWIKVKNYNGKVEKENREFVSIDWTKALKGKLEGKVKITESNGKVVEIIVKVNNQLTPKDNISGFIESNGFVSIEAEHYSEAITTSAIKWITIPDMGKTLSAVTPLPVTGTKLIPEGNSTRLEYKIHFFNEGIVKVNVYLSPTLNCHADEGLSYAISFDDQKPQIMNVHKDKNFQDWEESVRNNITVITSEHTIDKPGEHVLKYWMVNSGLAIQKIVIETGKVGYTYLGPPESYNSDVEINKK
jgi:Glycosyl hydrolase family 115/Gylcosyl hydrolase family 115 C-terminal domain